MMLAKPPLAGNAGIITGGGSGSGAVLAEALSAAGAKLCVADINPDRAERVAEAIRDSGGEAFGWQMDVANKFQAAAMVETTRDRYGQLDFLVQHAHVSPKGPALKVDEWDWRRTVEVNLTGAFICAQLCARVMADEGGGAIVLLTEPPGEDNGAGAVAFATTQTALDGLADGLATELEAQQVRVRTQASRNPQTLIEFLSEV